MGSNSTWIGIYLKRLSTHRLSECNVTSPTPSWIWCEVTADLVLHSGCHSRAPRSWMERRAWRPGRPKFPDDPLLQRLQSNRSTLHNAYRQFSSLKITSVNHRPIAQCWQVLRYAVRLAGLTVRIAMRTSPLDAFRRRLHYCRELTDRLTLTVLHAVM